MTRISRRIATIVAVGAFALPTLAACGAAEQAVDCANLSSTLTDVTGNIAGDTAALKQNAQTLRDQAKDIGDAGLKDSVNKLADSLERFADLQKKSTDDPLSLSEAEVGEMQTLASDIPSQAQTIVGKCSDVTS